jgi:VCBS repeat-containing protein
MGTLLYDGSTGFISATPGLSGLGIPGIRQLAYGQLPINPQSTGAGTPTLNTNLGAGNTGYAGYTNYDPLSVLTTFSLLNPTSFPTLDRTIGFTFSFNVAITAETSNPNRAGFNIIVISSDGAGIELGFKEEGANDRIFAQEADLTNALEAEQTNTNINVSTNYVLTVLGGNYTLSAGGINLLTGALRNYNFNPAASNPPLPFNPYISPNFLFLGDNTDQGNATFTLGAISVNAFPVANSDNYTTAESVPLTIAATAVLANDTDADNDLLTAVLETAPTNGTLTLNADGSFIYTPTANFSGTDSFTYRANDGTANSNNLATVAIAISAVADAPTLTVTPASGNPNTAIPLNINAALVDIDSSENLSVQIAGVPTGVSLSTGTNLGNGVWQLTSAQLAGLTLTSLTESNFNLTVTATSTEVSNSNTASTVATLNVTVNSGQINPNPGNPGQPSNPIQNPNDSLLISGNAGQTQLLFTLNSNEADFVNEVGVFAIDDDQGTVNGIAPSSVSYLQAALNRGTVIFSALPNLPNGFGVANQTRVLSVEPNTRLGFYLIQNSTTDTVLAELATGQVSQTVFFSFTSGNTDGFDHLQVEDQGNGVLIHRWEDKLGGGDRDFNDLVMTIQPTTTSTRVGARLQGESQQELIDLRNQAAGVQAQFTVNREAAFDNFVGFYKIVDVNGGIDADGNGTADVRPGDAGYVQAAIQQRVQNLDLTVANQSTATFSAQLEAGFIYAPFLIANGRPDALLDGNTANDPAVYFPFLAANSDRVDHIRLLGDNTFGFEDLPGGGDRDFNDAIVRVSVTA